MEQTNGSSTRKGESGAKRNDTTESHGERGERPTFRIDGAAFGDLDGFLDELGEELLRGAPWDRSLGALDAILEGGGIVPRQFRIIWEHSDLSRRRLGSEGPGSFTDLIDRIARHTNVELILS